MCGITGIFCLADEPLPDVLAGMNERLVHRGPDDAGSYRDERAGMAMRRLSIIGVDNGRQPIFNEDRSVVLVMNGEIYNHVALRQELAGRGHRFSTQSDAEVAVHLYEECGIAFLEKLRGMFGLALYDRSRGKLILARDRTGQKPLYYARQDGFLVFGSEIKAIHASGLVRKRVDAEAVSAYLAYGFVPGERTLFEGVRKLLAGCVLEVEAGSIEGRSYWDLPHACEPTGSLDEAAAMLRAHLEEAVELRLMSEVPLGAFLSGGADSSAIVAIMASKLGKPVKTFSVGFADPRLDELRYAKIVAEHFGTEHRELRVERCSPALLAEINWHQDEPAGDPASVPTFCLSKFARRHVTVALSGDGGDEVFAGYRHHRMSTRLSRFEAKVPGGAWLARGASWLEPVIGPFSSSRVAKGAWIAGLSSEDRLQEWQSAFTDRELRSILGRDSGPARRRGLGPASGLSDLRNPARDALDQILYVDFKSSLADHLMMKVDKMSMAASLEVRSPLLDHVFLEYACRLPSRFKLTGDGSKLVLRRAIDDLVPAEILQRGKQGFDVPIYRWLVGDLAHIFERFSTRPETPLAEVVDPAGVAALWERYVKRGDRRVGDQLWRIANLAVWQDLHWPDGLLEPGERPEAAPPAEADDPMYGETTASGVGA